MGIWQRKMDRALVNIQKTRILNEAQDFTLRCQRKALLGKKREIVLEWEIDKKTGKRKKKISLVLCEKKEQIQRTLIEEKKLPELPFEVEKVSYLDGSKVYFKNGGWIIARFSGTEPLLRIFSEMPRKEDSEKLCRIYEEYLGIA